MVELGNVQCITDVIVADIDMDAILGLDFLKTHDCQLDLVNDTLMIKGNKCQLTLAGKMGCYRVSVSEPIDIPPRSEVIVEGHVNLPALRKHELGIVEPTEKSVWSDKGLVGKTLVHTNDTIPVRIMNLSSDAEKIYPGTHIANLSIVSKVHDVKGKVPDKQTPGNIPSHLQDLYGKATVGLSQKQCVEVATLLSKHKTTFSESDSDLGRTGIIRHGIPTGTARPIKQPIRRLPVHMHTEAEQQIDDMLKKGVIQPSSSPWASGIVIVEKKDGSKRFCVGL